MVGMLSIQRLLATLSMEYNQWDTTNGILFPTKDAKCDSWQLSLVRFLASENSVINYWIGNHCKVVSIKGSKCPQVVFKIITIFSYLYSVH